MFPTTLTRASNGHVRRILIVALATLLLMGVLAIVPGAPLGANRAEAQATPPPADGYAGVCDVDVLFILDESGSMDGAGETSVRAGFKSFVNGLSATQSRIGVVEFNTTGLLPLSLW